MKKSFSQIKNEVHDASGIVNPEHYLWEQIGTHSGVWYPVLNVYERVDGYINELFYDVQNFCGASGDVDPHMYMQIKDIQEKLTKIVILQATLCQ